jgi:hypothetical protein
MPSLDKFIQHENGLILLQILQHFTAFYNTNYLHLPYLLVPFARGLLYALAL